MSSAAPALAEPQVWGCQEPRIKVTPPSPSSAGDEAIALAELAGLHLDPWQKLCVRVVAAEDEAGLWASPEVGLVVSRQNGKTSVLEAIALAKLFLWGERLVLWTSHEVKTSQESFRRLRDLIEGCPELRRRVAAIPATNGKEGVELRSGARLRFIARSKKSGRGFTPDSIICDEAMILTQDTLSALLPSMAARENGQVIYASSAGDADSQVLTALRARALSKKPGLLAWLEWSVPEDGYDPDSVEDNARANPGLGYRLTMRTLMASRSALSDEAYAREHLGVWSKDSHEVGVNLSKWNDCLDGQSMVPDGAVTCLAVDVAPDGKAAAIGAAGVRGDGLPHLEVIEYRPGVAWVVDHPVIAAHGKVVVDRAGPATELIPLLTAAGVDVVATTLNDVAAACGGLVSSLAEESVRIRPHEVLTAAAANAKRRATTEAWVFRRRDSRSDICPLMAVTLALWLLRQQPAGYDPLDSFF